jgi:hypothetical protein
MRKVSVASSRMRSLSIYFPSMTLRALVAVSSALCSLLATVATARAEDTRRACIDHNEQAQLAQKAGRLRDAQSHLVSCAGETCPPLVRADCARLLGEVSELVPSVIVDARDASGGETSDVRMYADDALVTSKLNGTAVELDPGPHTLRFEMGARTREQRIVLKEGEKRRRVSITFAEAVASTSNEPNRSSPWPWVFGGIAGAAVASFVTFAAIGYGDEKHLASHCAPDCTPGDVTSIKRDYVIADVSAGVAVVSLAIAVVMVWMDRSRAPHETAVRW